MSKIYTLIPHGIQAAIAGNLASIIVVDDPQGFCVQEGIVPSLDVCAQKGMRMRKYQMNDLDITEVARHRQFFDRLGELPDQPASEGRKKKFKPKNLRKGLRP